VGIAFSATLLSVRQGFSLGEANVVLKYRDDEGDLCTLTESAMDDLAELSVGPWRLEVAISKDGECQQVQESPKRTMCDSPAADGGGSGSSSSPVMEKEADRTQEEHALPEGAWDWGSSVGENFWKGGLCGNFWKGGHCGWGEASSTETVDSAVQMLSFLANLAQSPHMHAKISWKGWKQRELLLPLCGEILKELDRVPEASHLRPKLEAYIDRSDPYCLGDVMVELLKAWHTSASPEAVREVLTLHVESFKSAMRELHQHRGKGKGKEGKGFGKGFKGCKGWPWSFMSGGAHCAGAGFGEGLLKGFGKGKWCQGFWQAQQQEGRHWGENAAAEGGHLDEKVKYLLDAGLVSDPQLARDLLQAQGEYDKVVAFLTESGHA